MPAVLLYRFRASPVAPAIGRPLVPLSVLSDQTCNLTPLGYTDRACAYPVIRNDQEGADMPYTTGATQLDLGSIIL